MSTTLNDVNLTSATGQTQATSDNSTNLATTAFVQALSASTQALLSGNGWLKLQNGFMLQWGRVTTDINAGQLPVNFPTNFPNACFVVVACTLSPTDRITYVVNNSVNTNGFTIGNNGSSGFAYWVAVGH